MPSLFRSLLDPEVAAEAAGELLNELYHQGGFVCSAAVAALPFLIEAAESTDVTCRGDVLGIVGSLARTAREVASYRIADGWARAWAGAVPRLLVLLDDDDPHVRRAVTSVLVEAVTHADVVVGAIRDRWSAQDRSSRLDQVLSVGSLAGALTAETLPETLLWLRGLTNEPDEQLRFAATLALKEALPGRPVTVEPLVTALSGDVAIWSTSDHFPGSAALTVGRAIGRLGDDLDAREEIVLALIAHPDPGRRQGALRAAADLLSISRRPRSLLPALRERSADPDAETRTRANHLLAAHARLGGQDADLFAEHLGDRTKVSRLPTGADVATWGLAWSGDPRCLPNLVERLAAGQPGYPLSSVHGAKDHGYPMWTPSLQQILSPCPQWARTLLPVIRRRLHPGVEDQLGRALLHILEAWGPAAAPAVPQLTDLLGGQLRHWAAGALGSIGPAAASAEPTLRTLLDAPEADLDDPYARRAASVAVPWAYWRITGDPAPASRALGPRIGDDHSAIRRLADLGPQATAFVPTLRLLARALEPWTAVEAAYALIKITGDAAEGARILMRPVGDLLEGKAMPIVMAAARYLPALEDLPAGYRSMIQAVISDDRRHSWDGGWAAIHDDLELRSVLERVVSGGHSR